MQPTSVTVSTSWKVRLALAAPGQIPSRDRLPVSPAAFTSILTPGAGTLVFTVWTRVRPSDRVAGSGLRLAVDGAVTVMV